MSDQQSDEAAPVSPAPAPKPNVPGSQEPRTIAQSILPQRIADAERHPPQPEGTWSRVVPLDMV